MSTSPYYNKIQVDVKVDDLEQQIANVADGTAGKAYPNLTTAMTVAPLPANGVIFTIDEDNETEAGVYAYDSNEVNGYRFVRELGAKGKIEEGNTQAVSGGEVYNKIEAINDLIANFSGQIGSGIIGEAFPATIPISEGFGIYTVSTAGTFVNFKDVNNDPLIVSQADLDSGLVQLWGNDNVWDKHITLVDVFTPIFSDNLSDI